ncbi:MAG: hypothetical protein Q8M95_01095 [Candidatus Methanoperedens sp.]|nr:hypothetical protein [Candidatus Methanoperedens sp.]
MSETSIEYLFCWDEIPGKDIDKLREFLSSYHKWVKKAKIEKIDEGKTIKIFDEKNSIIFKLNNERTEAIESSRDGECHYPVKAEDGKLNVYLEAEVIKEELEKESPPTSFRIENELISFIRESKRGKRFWQERLQDKIEREKKAWDLLYSNTGKINKDILEQIFDIVDLSETYTGSWWGQLLKKPNRNKIFSNPEDRLNIWVNYLLNGKEPESVRIEKCIENSNYKLNGAGKGLVTLFLYLKDPASFNVMMDTTSDGLEKLGRFDSKKGKRKWGEYYNDYNAAVKEFRDQFGLEPQSIDWVLTNISSHGVQKKEDGGFIGYWYEDGNAVKDLEKDFVHPTKELIQEAFYELGATKTSRIELITKLKEIVRREGKILVNDETVWKEIQELRG